MKSALYPNKIFAPFMLMVFLGMNLSKTLAQTYEHPSTENILLALKQIPHTQSLLYIAAHPDDENNRLLTYLVKGKQVRTGYLALTRGEGGQNLIGKEQGESLGLVRTEELLAARKVDGAEQFFTRAIDFGYSKSPEETLNFWNRDSILFDMVWVIRKFQPDILVDRFPTTGEGGHGNHTASAILSLDAIRMAADPKAFPIQLKYVQTWAVKKAYWNTFNFGGLNLTASDQYHFQVNDLNPFLGMTYGELAALSRSNHKSQGFGTGSGKGEQYEYFKPLKGMENPGDFWAGLDSTWEHYPGASLAFHEIQLAIHDFNPENPSQIIPHLLESYKSIKTWETSPLQDRKLKEISSLILACSGIKVECLAPKSSYSFQGNIPLSIDISNRGNRSISIQMISLGTQESYLPGPRFASIPLGDPGPLGKNKTYHTTYKIELDSGLSTQPYQIQINHTNYRYQNPRLDWTGLAKSPDPIFVRVNFSYDGVLFSKDFPIQVRLVDPVKGEYFEPVSIVPPISLESTSPVYLFSNGLAQKIQVQVKAMEDNLESEVSIKAPSSWKISPASIPLHFQKAEETKILDFELRPLSNSIHENHLDSAILMARISGKTYSNNFHRIEYEHIPWITYTNSSQVKLIQLNLKTPPLTIGYIEGAGDYVPNVLNQLGYTVHLIMDDELNTRELAKYKTIILGVRAFNVRNSLVFAHEALMEFVKNGGNLIVQYMTTANLLTNQIGPYPFQISRDRITDETAEVHFLNPSSDLLKYPNLISTSDFNGWIQERGLYFPSPLPLDSPYKTVLSMKDPGESELNTSIIYTPYGKGTFIYTGLSFFRELPAGVPGAIRLFVNLINAHHE